MDAVEPELTEQATSTLRATEGVLDVEYLRLRWIGHRISAEAGVLVNSDLDLRTAHGIAHDAQHRLLHEMTKLSAATIHVSPQEGHEFDPHQVIDHHNTLS